MSHTSHWLRRTIAVVAIAAASAFTVAATSDASPASFSQTEPEQVEAENGDWPW